jgi:hypothetical protein
MVIVDLRHDERLGPSRLGNLPDSWLPFFPVMRLTEGRSLGEISQNR